MAKIKRSIKPKQAPLWQREKLVKRENKKVRINKFWVGFCFIGLFVLSVIIFFRMINSGVWKGDDRFNFVIGDAGGGDVALVSFSTEDADVLILYFDSEVIVNAIYGYGEYKVGSLLRLGRIEGLSSDILTKSMQQTMGIRVHEFVSTKINDASEIDGEFLKKLIIPMTKSLIGHPLGVTDLFEYIKKVSKVRADQIEVISINESRLAYSEELPDGSLVYKLDLERVDGFLQDRVTGISYLKENLGVSIVNTTNRSGLASSLSRILLNSGVDVVSVGENQNNIDKSIILVNNKDISNSKTLALIKGVFDCEIKIGGTDEYRADIVVLLGKDYFDFLSEKP